MILKKNIPKIIHQTYKNNLDYQHLSNSWIKYHPKWKYIFYSDNDIYEFIKNNEVNINIDFPNLVKFFRAVSMIEKIDLFRYLLLYYKGGVYCDIDTTCYQNFNNLCQNESCILGIEAYINEKKRIKMDYKYRYSIGNAIIISESKHPFLKKLLHNIINNNVPIPKNDVEYICQKTGPGIMTKTFQRLIKDQTSRVLNYQNKRVRILDQIFFYPPSNPPIFNIYPLNVNIHCNHLCEGNWKENKTDLFNQMDFIPYPWIWMYKYRFDYILLHLTITPLLYAAIKLKDYSIIMSFQILFTYVVIICYHILDSLSIKSIFGFNKQQLHKLDNILGYNLFTMLSVLDYYRENIFKANLYSIIFGFITTLYYLKFTNNLKMELLYLIPFILYLNKYFIIYPYLAVLSVFFFYLGLFDFDYYSSRKYHSAWHLCSSLLFYMIINEIVLYM